MISRLSTPVLLLITAHAAAQAADASAPAAARDVVAVAKQAGSFETLLAAAQAAGLVDALRGPGPVTVFAPTDEAFAKLGKKTIDGLLEPKSKRKLAAILAFHVVPGTLRAAQVVRAKSLQSLSGEQLTVQASDDAVKVGGAVVTKTDITASNGVIHVIDTVLLPPERQDLVATAGAAGSFGTLAKALGAAGLVEALQGEGPFTVFAPTDAAFAKLDPATLERLLQPENKAELVRILQHHVVPGRVLARDVVKLEQADTLAKTRLPITASAKGVTVGGAKVTQTDVLASNGVIHVVDTVLLPPAKR